MTRRKRSERAGGMICCDSFGHCQWVNSVRGLNSVKIHAGLLWGLRMRDLSIMLDEGKCRLCESSHGNLVKRESELRREFWECRKCGQYRLSPPFSDRMEKSVRLSLRGLAVERRLRRMGWLDVNSETIDVLLAQVPQNPSQAADRLLLNLAIRSSEPGIYTALDIEHDQGMAFTEAIDSFIGFLEFLKSDGLIEYGGDRYLQPDFSFRLTLTGWRKVELLQSAGASSSAAFVAMSFNGELDRVYEDAIAPAIKAAGWSPVRADRTHHLERIDDWVLNQIRAAKFVVVDSTYDNPGAAFEAGYALGKGRPVIWTVKDEWMAKGLHFDFRQFNHLNWKLGDENLLVEPLRERIIATVGTGPDAA